MPSLLIITRDRQFREECRTALRKFDFRLLFFDEILDGMRELNWCEPKLMIWDMESGNIRQLKALSVLREKHPLVPLFVVLEDMEMKENVIEMADAVADKSESIRRLVSKAKKLIGNPVPTRSPLV